MRASRSAHEGAEMSERRREAGAWLRRLRENRGFTQRQLAECVGIDYYTFVSQIESGRGRIPADRYQKWANALEVDPKDFVRNILSFYEPATYKILFDASHEISLATDNAGNMRILPRNVSPLRS